MRYVIIVPSIYRPWTTRCVASMNVHKLSNLVIVDNVPPNENLGVAGSWNVGARRVLDQNLDWLVICSAACRFGAPHGQDWLDALDAAQHDGAVAVEAAHGIGWHLIAFSRQLIERVGLFDENFYPAYFEDNDYSWRIKCAYDLSPPYWPKVSVDVAIAGFRHGIDLGGAQPARVEDQLSYYREKWGGAPGDEKFTRPWNVHTLDYWPERQS